MRRFVSILLSLAVLLSCSMAFAQNPMAPMNRFYAAVKGVWCDQDGHRKVVFGDDNIMNGIRVSEVNNLVGDNLNGSATITVIGKMGVNYVNVFWDTTAGKKSIKLGNYVTLVPYTGDPQYVESVGGLHLDMTEPEVENRYGAAQLLDASATKALCGVSDESWYYPNIGLVVTFDPVTFTADRLILLKGASSAFDISVLNADSPLYKYSAIYGWSFTPAPGDIVDMGYGQSMNFKYYPQAVMLQLNYVN
ncbi:hypothetical protein D081_1737 [Anaerovibrio sp. JC8]|uniref:hypothetical protein n=1 Tax=Anaerovibrio sp. JC8 TaxID=1240085 RepID=UPI000A0CA5FF|nr:hypothetical protein [Anaerovibrio sp. JC8]ORT99587.1 hypothetical protein D081_1737 [Anaerovibrio sp. JC8]